MRGEIPAIGEDEMIDDYELARAACAMEAAYDTNPNMQTAIDAMTDNDEFKHFPDGILRGMWLAIDSYVDMNT